MCGIQAGFDGKSLLPLNFRSLSGASPLPPHPPFPLFLRPTSSLHWEHSPCTRVLRAGAAPPPPGGGADPTPAPQDSGCIFPGVPTPSSLPSHLPRLSGTHGNPVLWGGGAMQKCALQRLAFAPLVGISVSLGLATSSCVARPASVSSSLCSPCPGSDYISPHV